MVRRQQGTRAQFGTVRVNHKGKNIFTSVGSRQYEDMFGGDTELQTYPRTLGAIPTGYAHRPDLMANLFIGTQDAWWMVCERNSIFDIFEQLNAGDQLFLPIEM